MLHILAKRNWIEYGKHNWDKYEELCRTSVQVASTFPKSEGLDRRSLSDLTPLMAAAAGGNDVMAFELVRAKCDIHAVLKKKGEPDRTAMDMAACCKRSDILEVLARNGGNGLCECRRDGNGFQQKKHRRW